MNINCGCFATPEPIHLKKILQDAAMSALAIDMTACAYIEARKPTPGPVPQNPKPHS